MTGLPGIIGLLFSAYELIIIVFCVLTFIPRLYNSAFGRFIAGMVAPFLNLISRIIPTRFGFIDISPIIALILVQIAEKVIFYII
ncbi:YggT family protein [Companilactobacillus mishanensis]|nr:YggT family protein [Companilactobacillus mishanensis]